MQGPPVYRIINIKSWAKEEILNRLSTCDFHGNPYVIDILPCEENQEHVLGLLELYFNKKFANDLRLYPLYIISTYSIPTQNFYIVNTTDEIAKHFKEHEKKNLSPAETNKLKLYKSGIDHFNSIPPLNKKGILLAYAQKRKELYLELKKKNYFMELKNKL